MLDVNGRPLRVSRRVEEVITAPVIRSQLGKRFQIEGRSADELKAQAAREGLGNLVVRPWVSFAELPGVLADADVLVAMIEADAGTYSVPSKVLTYLAAGRPILAAIPPGNLAARLLDREQAGLTRAPRRIGDGAAPNDTRKA